MAERSPDRKCSFSLQYYEFQNSWPFPGYFDAGREFLRAGSKKFRCDLRLAFTVERSLLGGAELSLPTVVLPSDGTHPVRPQAHPRPVRVVVMVATKRPRRRPPLQTFLDDLPHPSECRGNPYGQDTRLNTAAIVALDLVNTGTNALLRAIRRAPSKRTIRRWRRRWQTYGDVRAFRRSGNRRATVLRGLDLLNLAYFRVIFPKATQAEMNVLLFGAQIGRGEPWPRFFSPSQITKAEDRLGLSRKRGSTTAYQALLPINLIRRDLFWNRTYPVGRADIDSNGMIDIDEAAVFIETCNRKHGKGYIGCRIREEGPYNHSEKWTITMAIAGDLQGMRHRRFERKAGTTTVDFLEFIQEVIAIIGPGTPARRRCFTMDNLLAHKHPAVIGHILMSGHRILFRAPYYAVDGPIEYFFNTLQHQLTVALPRVRTSADLQIEVDRIIRATPNFRNYFTSLGL